MFLITVTHKDGYTVSLKPGGHAEREILSEVKEKLRKAGVGWFKSEHKVLAAVHAAIEETLFALKSDVLP